MSRKDDLLAAVARNEAVIMKKGAGLPYRRNLDYLAKIRALEPKPTARPSAPVANDEPLSSDPAEAENQLLRRLGFDPAVTFAPGAVLGAASPEQNRQLVLLGLFGTPDDQATFPTADFTLYSQYNERVGGGGWAPKEPYANTGTWQAYIASKGV